MNTFVAGIPSVNTVTASTETNLDSNVMGIDHIAVAVPDLEAAVAWATGKLGGRVIEQRETRGRLSGMRSAVVKLGGSVMVFVQGIGEDSQVSQFVEKHGAGVQHIALQVMDIGKAIADYETLGMAFSTPRLDSPKLSQRFSQRDPATGLMIELIERRNYDGFSDDNVQKLFESLEGNNLY